MATKVKFYTGNKEKYSYNAETGSMNGVLYFAKDTHTLYLNGVPYGHPLQDVTWTEDVDKGTLTFITETGDSHTITVDLGVATQSIAGLFSAADKTKLDAIKTQYADTTKGSHEKYLNEKSEFVTLNSSNVDVIGEDSEYKAVAFSTVKKNVYRAADYSDTEVTLPENSKERNLLIGDGTDDVTTALAKLETRADLQSNVLNNLNFKYDPALGALEVTGDVSQTNGQLSATRKAFTAKDKSITLTGGEGTIDFALNPDKTTIYQDATGVVKAAAVVSSANSAGNESGAIKVNFDATNHTYTPTLTIDAADPILSTTSNGLFSHLALEYDSTSESLLLKGRVKIDGDTATEATDAGTKTGDKLIISKINVHDFLVDGMLDDVQFVVDGTEVVDGQTITHKGAHLKMTFAVNNTTANSSTGDQAIVNKVIWVPVEDLVDTYTAGNGIELTNVDADPDDTNARTAKINVKVASDSDTDKVTKGVMSGTGNQFLQSTEDGLKLVGVSTAIDRAREEAQTEITQVAKETEAVKNITQDGVTFSEGGQVFATDAATMTHEYRSTGGHFAIEQSISSSDGHYTYTISEIDVASASVVNNLAPEIRTASAYDTAMATFANGIKVNGQNGSDGSKTGVNITVKGIHTEVGSEITASADSATMANDQIALSIASDAKINAALQTLLTNDNYIANELLIWHEV